MNKEKYYDIKKIMNSSAYGMIYSPRGTGKQYAEKEAFIRIIINKKVNMYALLSIIEECPTDKEILECYNGMCFFKQDIQLTMNELQLIEKVVKELSHE